MFNIKIDTNYRIDNINGVQDKFLFNNSYYKIDKTGSEGITEELSSLILSCSTLKPEEYIIYENGFVNSLHSCKSENFLKNSEKFIDFNTLHLTVYDERLDWHLRRNTMQEKIEYTINFLKESTGLDVTDYLRKNITLDYIIKNTDRHFSNLGIIVCDNETFKTAPIFDNGAGLMSNMSIMYTKSIEENLDELKAKPFSDNINNMYEYFGPGFQVDFKHVLEILDKKYNLQKGMYGYEQVLILKYQANKLLTSELNIENTLERKIEEFKAEYKIENGKLILNEIAQKECKKLIEQGIITDIRQYPMYKDMQR